MPSSPVFDQALRSRASQSSSLGPHLVPQTHGDPNYYAAKPAFDSKGFWQSAGTMPPPSPPSGSPSTPSRGSWVAHGSTSRNGQTTTRWIWYPPSSEAVTIGSSKVGSKQYVVAQKRLSMGGTKVFSAPDYWVHEQIVPEPPKSTYSPQSSEYDTVELAGIVPVVGTFHCKKWLLVASQTPGGPSPDRYVTLPGGIFDAATVFRFYAKYVGYSPYFTYDKFLFRFIYTGYDAKTKTWRQGKNYKYEIQMCVDGLDVQKNPPGDYPEYTVYAPGGSGGALVVHQGVGKVPGAAMQSAFDSIPRREVGLGRSLAFDAALLRGLGREPQGLGQQLNPIPLSGRPDCASDWIEFYPTDKYNYLGNTTLGNNLNVVGTGMIDQIMRAGTGITTYWFYDDAGHTYAAWTIGLQTGRAYIRSSFDSNGGLHLAICSEVKPADLQLVPGAVLNGTVNGSNVCGGGTQAAAWAQLAPTNFVGTQPMSSDDISNQVGYYLQYIGQSQFIVGTPMDWSGTAPVPQPGAPSEVYFAYKGQLYRMRQAGWVVGQGMVSGSYVIIEMCLNPPLPQPAPPWLQPIKTGTTAATGYSAPPGLQPIILPVTASSAPLPASLQVVGLPAPGTFLGGLGPGIAGSTGTSSALMIAAAIVGLGVLGGVAYLVLD